MDEFPMEELTEKRNLDNIVNDQVDSRIEVAVKSQPSDLSRKVTEEAKHDWGFAPRVRLLGSFLKSPTSRLGHPD